MFRMKFVSGMRTPIKMAARRPGIKMLDAVRAVFGSEVTYADLEDLPEMEQDVEVELTEEDARASGQFMDPHADPVELFVPAGSLNRFVRFEPVRREDGRIGWEVVIDKDGIVEAWRSEKFPHYWTP